MLNKKRDIVFADRVGRSPILPPLMIDVQIEVCTIMICLFDIASLWYF